MGLSAGLVVGTWGPLPLGLLVAGAAAVGLGLLLQAGSSHRKPSLTPQAFWKRRSTRTSTNALVSTLAVLTILGLLNFLSTRYPTRIDLTENKQFTLAPQTQQVLRALKQPVKVLVFDSQPQPATRSLLEQYQRQGQSLFSFEFIDPQAQPGLVQKYQVQPPGEVIVESGRRVQHLDTPVSEPSLTPAIAQATSPRESKAYFLQGHGERALEAATANQGGLSQAIAALKGRNFITEPLNLRQRQQVPEDASVVIIAAPQQGLFAAEVQRLRDYLNRRGGLLLMVEPQTKPGLESLLKDWGVQLDNRLVVDASGQGQLVGLGPAVPLVNQYGEHPITQDFDGQASFYPLAQPVQAQPAPNREATDLLITGAESWAESNPASESLEFNPDRDRKGPLTLGVALSRSAKQSPATQRELPESRLVVIGDVDFATDGLFNQQLNGDVFLNAVTWLSKADERTLSVRPKEQTNRRINLTPQRSRLVTLLAVGILPFAAFGTAASLWWRRR